MLDPHWVFLGAALGLLGSARYSLAIVRGSVRPNLVTWSLWGIAPIIAFFAQLDAGVGLPAVMTLAAGLGPTIVVTTSLISRRYFARFGMFDLACAIVAVIALAVWLGLGDAPMAVFFAVAADGIAALPTVIKAWRHPDSENALFYLVVSVGSTITLLTISTWNPEAWAFVAYQFAICMLLAIMIPFRRRALGDRPNSTMH